MVTPDHPRPTFARPTWKTLDGPWEFAVGSSGDRPLASAWDRMIQVPFPPESDASGVGLARCDHPRYRRSFEADVFPGRRWLLHCEGVDQEARVWVDGQLAGTHAGGYTPFALDVTDVLSQASTHEVVIAASDLAHDLEHPRGKQDWHAAPRKIWYGRSSGIWRTVWLEDVPAVRLESASWTTLDTFGRLQGAIRLAGWAEGEALVVEASFGHRGVHLGTVAVEATASFVELTARLGTAEEADTPELYWSPDNPALIDVRLRLLRGADVLDVVEGYTGLRTVGVRDGHLELNGVALFSRLVLEQAFWPASHFTAPSLEALRAEAELIRALGFNGLRMHQVTADPRFLRACDELGLMVWADCPAAYVFSQRSLQLTTRTLIELVDRDRNHPCVVAWVPFNESWGVPEVASSAQQRRAVSALYELAKALDPTRLAIGTDGWENVAGDLVGVHDYAHDPSVLRARYGSPQAVATTLATGRPGGRPVLVAPFAPGTPVVLSEFGGLSLPRLARSWGYGEVADPDELVSGVAALVGAVGPSSGLAGFCWTQLSDTLHEQNGLTWPDRTPKASLVTLAAAIRGG
ncbi:MAG: glycoside hydrolase family 2 TIM barrel-domain containing protein [Actinomycetes bacterium]